MTNITRDIILVTVGDDSYTDASVLYIDGIRKEIMQGELSASDLIGFLKDEGPAGSGNVLHIKEVTCNQFLDEVCLGEVHIFERLCPELFQHLRTDQS